MREGFQLFWFSVLAKFVPGDPSGAGQVPSGAGQARPNGVIRADENTYESITLGYFESTKINETTYKIEFYFNGGTITGSFEYEFIFQN